MGRNKQSGTAFEISIFMKLYPVSVTMFSRESFRKLNLIHHWENENASKPPDVLHLNLLFSGHIDTGHWSILYPLDIPKIGEFQIFL